jgi:hypothetical protein
MRDLPSVHALIETIRKCGYTHGPERDMQRAVDAALHDAGVPTVREYRLGDSTDRVDVLADGEIAIECKVKGSPAEIARQLDRYAKHEEIERIILVTTRLKHAAGIPEELQGKPVHVVALGVLA